MPSPTPAAPPATSAVLVVERFSIVVYPAPRSAGGFVYDPRFQIRETAGRSGATINEVSIIAPNGDSDITGPECWRDALRVPPGGTLDTFYTDAGVQWLGYCAPAAGGRTDTPEVRVRVTFTDDDGHQGTVSGTSTVRK